MSHFQTRHFTWAICGCCEGNGKVDHPAFSNGFTSSEWDDMGDDWDGEGETNGQDRYMSGMYDVPCTECSGTGKVKQPDFYAMPRAERRAYIAHLRQEREDAMYAHESFLERQAEQRMGC